MKNYLLPLLTGAALLTAQMALAQEKPTLNTAPPGSAPAPVTPPPVYQPAPVEPTAPVPTPAAPPTPGSPSGLELPSTRDARQAGGSSSETLQRMFLYANFGLGYSSSYPVSQFNASIAPALGYRFTKRFAAGPGITYSYLNYSLDDQYVFPNGSSRVSSSNVGVKVFAQYIAYKEFFLHAEYEVTRAELLNSDYTKSRRTIASPLAGIGYRSQLGERAAADIVVLYNFDDTLYSLYSNPVIRFSFLFNLGR
jgi:hypothetical protein